MKTRLDNYLIQKFNVKSREKAKAYIMSGIVFVNGQKETKPGKVLKDIDNVELRLNFEEFASRGGQKLNKAIKEFNINVQDKVCMDIGASTGGFTDCLLKNGAKKVFSIDVGYGQLCWELRNNKKVINLERQNFRKLEFEQIGEKVDFVCIDVSFISLTKILDNIKKFIKEDTKIICLIKPQFETEKEKVGKNGVVRDISVHVEVCKKIFEYLKIENFNILNFTFSPIKGPKGNIEYLIYIENKKFIPNFTLDNILNIIYLANDNL